MSAKTLKHQALSHSEKQEKKWRKKQASSRYLRLFLEERGGEGGETPSVKKRTFEFLNLNMSFIGSLSITLRTLKRCKTRYCCVLLLRRKVGRSSSRVRTSYYPSPLRRAFISPFWQQPPKWWTRCIKKTLTTKTDQRDCQRGVHEPKNFTPKSYWLFINWMAIPARSLQVSYSCFLFDYLIEIGEK